MNINSREVKVEEAFGRRKFHLDFEAKIKNYEKRMLCESDCPNTLPMVFLYEEERQTAYCDFTDMIQLEQYVKRYESSMVNGRSERNQIKEALEILSEILEGLKNMESYLLLPERIAIHSDTIFIHPLTGQIKFVFYPVEKPEETFQSSMIALVDEMMTFYCDKDPVSYFMKFREQILQQNLGLDGMINSLGILRREVNYVYWNPINLRELSENEASTEMARGVSDLTLKRSFSKPVLIHVLIGVTLAAVFLAEVLETIQFAGLLVLAAGTDLMIMKKMRFI